MRKTTSFLTACAVLLTGVSAQAAFIAKVGTSNQTFGGDTTGASTSIDSAAVGLAGAGSLFGGNGVTSPDTYVMSYTPGTDVDNFSPAAGSLLGSTTGFGTELASGVTGGGSGTYKVYLSVPSSTNVNVAGSKLTVNGDGSPVVLSALNLNDAGTGADLDAGPAFVGGANNSWLLLGSVDLTAGTTYTVTMEANVNSFVSQRLAGVMWEAVPEPTSFLLFGMGGCGLALSRRRS